MLPGLYFRVKQEAVVDPSIDKIRINEERKDFPWWKSTFFSTFFIVDTEVWEDKGSDLQGKRQEEGRVVIVRLD